MEDDTLALDRRHFLKTVGVTTQRSLDPAIRDALAAGRLTGDETLTAKVTPTLEPAAGTPLLTEMITSEIDLA